MKYCAICGKEVSSGGCPNQWNHDHVQYKPAPEVHGHCGKCGAPYYWDGLQFIPSCCCWQTYEIDLKTDGTDNPHPPGAVKERDQ